MKTRILMQKPDLPLQVVLLFLSGVALLIAGTILSAVETLGIRYYDKGLYGSFLFVIALQIVILGETPFGPMRKTKPLLSAGALVATVGIVTCFIPDMLGEIPRILLFLCLTPGGLYLLADLFFAKAKYRAWIGYGGIFQHLIRGCGAVYFLSVLMGFSFLMSGRIPVMLTGSVALLYGAAIGYLAWVLSRVYARYPENRNEQEKGGTLDPDQAVLLLVGIFMILLGVLLIPVSFGILPFSGSAQLGLLMLLFAVQMLAFGSTPLGPFPRSWLMILLGLLFGALGITSCLWVDVLVPILTKLIGVFNIAGGSITLMKTGPSLFSGRAKGNSPVFRILTRLNVTQLAMSLISILFGGSMLASGSLPGYIIGVVLAANGVVLLYLLHLLLFIENMKRSGEVCS